MGYKGVRRGYKVRIGHKELQGVTKGYKGLQEITGG